MEDTHELHIAAEPEGLEVGRIIRQGGGMVLVPILLAVVLIFPIANKSIHTLSLRATTESGSPVKSNADAMALTKLNNYRVVDRAAGQYQIPIDRAMELMVNREQSRDGRVVSSVMPR